MVRTWLGCVFVLAACARPLPARSVDVGPTATGEPVMIDGGCCVRGYGCAGPDDQGVYWIDYDRKIPCFSTCGNVVEGFERWGTTMYDSRTPVEVPLTGQYVDMVCL